MYGTCPNCKTSVKLPRGSERAEPEAERDPYPSDWTGEPVEVRAGDLDAREVPVPEAVTALDEAVTELYELEDGRTGTVSELAERIEERKRSVDELEKALEEVARYFKEFVEEVGGELEYEEIDPERPVPTALENMEIEGAEV